MKTSNQPVWLITGAAGALGRELVRLALIEGLDCIALDRNARGLDQLHDSLLAQGLSAPALVPLDLTGAGPDDYVELADTIGERFGRLDALIHAAAQFTALKPLEHQAADDWFATLQAGLTGPFLLNAALLPLLRTSQSGAIVLVNNLSCLERPARWGAYGVCQAGRQQMVQTLAAELGPRGPRVLEIDPGPFYSPLRSAAWPAETPEELPPASAAAAGIMKRLQSGES